MTRQHHHRQMSFPSPGRMDMDTSEQELMLKSWRRDGRTIALGAAAGVLVLVLMAVTAALLSGGRGGRGPREELVTMADVMGYELVPREFNGTWVSDTQFLYQMKWGNPVLYDVKNSSSRNLITNDTLVAFLSAVKYELSSDGKFLLAVRNVVPVGRYVYHASYDIVELQTQTSWELGPRSGSILQLVVWAPVGNGLAYVYCNDIYYRSSARDLRDVRLTSNGEPYLIYNGVPDWSYQEEILRSNTAMWFSLDGKHLAYATFNDSDVGVVPMPYYSGDDLYPKVLELRYPKPGTPIPRVRLHVVDVECAANDSGTTLTLAPSSQFPLREHILIGVQWVSRHELASIWNNRLQNKVKVLAHSVVDGSSLGLIYSLEDRNGWLEPGMRLHFSANGSLVLLVVGSQIARIKRRHPVDSIEKALTGADHLVTRILGWDENRGQVFFLGSSKDKPAEQHVYRVADTHRGEGKLHTPSCLSCQLTLALTYAPCLHATASFSPGHSFYMMQCNGPEVPEASIYNRQDERVILWEENQSVRDRMVNKLLPVVCPTSIPLPGGHQALVRMWLPPNYDISKSKYPLLVHVYGAPGQVEISERFHIDWHTHLVANRSIVYVKIEGRGSRLLGLRARSAGHRRLGSLEVEDQILVVKELIQRYNYIDGAKVGIWGWSYGGYSALLTLAQDEDDVFRCGIAVAPIVSWRHYNALYTERYMRQPTTDDNLVGYEEAELSTKGDLLTSKKVLLLHGTMDTVVHYYHSLMMVRALREHGVPFQMQSYPGETHGLQGARPHVFRAMEKFLEDCFPLD